MGKSKKNQKTALETKESDKEIKGDLDSNFTKVNEYILI